jgi:hypothetical protein
MHILLRIQNWLFDEDFHHPCAQILMDMRPGQPRKIGDSHYKKQCFHPGDFCRDLQMKRQQFSIGKIYFSRYEVVPYLLSSSLGNHASFL